MTTRAGIAAFAAAMLVVTSPEGASAPIGGRLLEPVLVVEDFSGDGLGQFASYPPAQDIGYEPSLAPTSGFGAPGGRALMRVVTPTATGPLSIGVIRRMPLVVSAESAITLQYRLDAPGATAIIEAGFAGADGVRYEGRREAATGGWQPLTLSRGDLRADGSGSAAAPGTSIDALYVVVHVTAADPAVTYRFFIDDVRVRGDREAAFEVRRPDARAVAAGDALTAARGFAVNDAIAIDVTAPGAIDAVECVLRSADGAEIARGSLARSTPTYGPAPESGRIAWSAPRLHVVRESDPRGVWTAELEGRAADGRRMRAGVRFIAGGRGSPPHPRLYFSAADRGRLSERTRHPAMAALWRQTREAAAASRASGPIAHGGAMFERLDHQYLLPSLPGYFDVLNRARARIANNALVAWVDDDAAARGAAKTALLEVAAWSRWEPPWFTAHGQHTYYPAGQLASAVALAYDLLYDSLSDDERARVRRALMERSILPTWREYVLDNRAIANTSNWISHTVGGAIQAALAIVDDGAPDEVTAVHRPLNGLLLKIEAHMAASFLADGSYGEGISYQEFALETLGPMLHAAERVLGHSYWNRTSVLQSLAYPLHTLAQPVSDSLDMGDTHPPGGHGIGPVVSRSTDPVVRWYGGRFAPRTIYDFIFFNDDVAPVPPAGEGSRLFAEKGNAVFRTGWRDDSAIVLFRAGPTANHNHNDQGAFLVRNFGETLLTEAGWSDYYKDPYYGPFFTQGIGHNTLLVDGHPESQVIADTAQFAALRRYPRITEFVTSPFYDGVGSDLAPVYPALAAYTRRLAFLKPDLLVVFDRVRAHALSRFDALLHVTDRDRASIAGREASYHGARGSFALRVFASGPFDIALRDGHIPYGVFAARTPPAVPPRPGFLAVSTTEPAQNGWILSAIAMGARAEEADAIAAAIRPAAAPGLTGVRAAVGGRHAVVLFRTDEAGTPLSFEQWTTDAAAWMAGGDGGAWRVALQRARVVRLAAQPLLAADTPVDAALEADASDLTASVRAASPTVVRLFSPRAPARVTINGRAIARGAWRYEGRAVVVRIAAGESRIHIEAAGTRRAP